ncbi:unnamed protein product, partial [Porites lobata]
LEHHPPTLGFPLLLILGYPPRPIYQQRPRSSLNLQCFFRLKWLLVPARWVGPETERIPQPVPDPNNRGHFRTPDDYLPRKCLKDLYEEHPVSIINDGNTIKSFCFQKTMLMRSMLLHTLIILKLLISEKTLDQEKLKKERGKRRKGNTRTSNGTLLFRVARSKS